MQRTKIQVIIVRPQKSIEFRKNWATAGAKIKSPAPADHSSKTSQKVTQGVIGKGTKGCHSSTAAPKGVAAS